MQHLILKDKHSLSLRKSSVPSSVWRCNNGTESCLTTVSKCYIPTVNNYRISWAHSKSWTTKWIRLHSADYSSALEHTARVLLTPWDCKWALYRTSVYSIRTCWIPSTNSQEQMCWGVGLGWGLRTLPVLWIQVMLRIYTIPTIMKVKWLFKGSCEDIYCVSDVHILQV